MVEHKLWASHKNLKQKKKKCGKKYSLVLTLKMFKSAESTNDLQ